MGQASVEGIFQHVHAKVFSLWSGCFRFLADDRRLRVSLTGVRPVRDGAGREPIRWP
jgi:hypothetical protein